MSTQLKFLCRRPASGVPGSQLAACREINEDPNVFANKQCGAGLIYTQPARMVKAHGFLACGGSGPTPSPPSTSTPWSSVETEIEKPALLLGRWLREIRKITRVAPS